VPNQIIVSVRTSYAALAWAGDAYLSRARSLTSRAEALGATLAAWSATTFAFAWDGESLEEAISFAVSLREEAPRPEHAFACGIAEGHMELLAPSGQRAELAWGPALVLATSLARIAMPGEVLLDGDVRAMRAGELATTGTRTSTDAGRRVRGWKLDVERPYRKGSRTSAVPVPPPPPPIRLTPPPSDPALIDVETTAKVTLPPSFELPSDPDRTDEHGIVIVSELEELPEDALEVADANTAPSAAEGDTTWNDATEVRKPPPESPPPPLPPANGSARPPAERVSEQLRAVAASSRAPSAATLIALRRKRVQLEGAPPGARCQASLALAMALSLAGRHDEALLEALDATARAREASDPRATAVCLTLLAKVYAAAGRAEDAARLLAARDQP
jgi:hypothetical protein